MDKFTNIVATLWKIVTCQHGDKADEMICDQLVEETAIPRLCEQLLLEPELTLQKAIVTAGQIESAIAEA